MKGFLSVLIAAMSLLALGQGHDLKPAEAMKNLAFLKGDWAGKQDFNTGGPAMVGEASNHIDEAIGGRYMAEMLSTSLPGRKPTDTRHFISYDPKAAVYRAWWFTDTSVGPMEFEGTLTGTKLVLLNKVAPGGNQLRATYDSPTSGKLVYTLELKQGDNWQLLFTTTYAKKG
jgi:hypothetical protein